jgi:hypothetical protein|tara:strand:- start:666 stop:839 length:174 start_codon:yes stop_codon:yes gene_type:complete
MELINDTWYWLSDPREGDIFYPVFIVDDTYMLVDGETHVIEKSLGANFDLAVMPIKD